MDIAVDNELARFSLEVSIPEISHPWWEVRGLGEGRIAHGNYPHALEYAGGEWVGWPSNLFLEAFFGLGAPI